ncbi:MAG: GspH/FimT family pseudopilin [Planctomycetota bacterium]|nr:GspH/FimT family pseudopilin [Planctomycetota bacterium]
MHRSQGGFTLIEVLLTLMLMGLLLGALIVNFSALSVGQDLEEGASRLETALRMARADAANLGRRLRLAFDEIDGRFIVFWEADPLGEPGRFTEYTACTWDDFVSMDHIRLVRCQLVGPSLYQVVKMGTAGGGGDITGGPAAITFEPDGSSDSVIIEVSAADERDTRHIVIELEGLTGTVASRILSPEEIAPESAPAP